MFKISGVISKNSCESNTAAANKVNSSLGSSLQTEKEPLKKIRTELHADNSEFQTSISSKIEKLQEDLATTNKIMDQVIVKTEKSKVLSVKLSNANS